MSGSWFDWLNSQPGGMQQQQAPGPQGPPQWPPQPPPMPPNVQNYMQPMQPPGMGQMNPAMMRPPMGPPQMPPQAPPGAGADPNAMIRGLTQAGMTQDQFAAMQNILRQAQQPGGSLMGQLQAGLGQQRPPGYGLDGGGASYSPYAMPGTPQYNPNGM